MNQWMLTLSLLLFPGMLLAQSDNLKHHAQAKIDCQVCHTCNIPTHTNPCLKLFPDFRREGITLKSSAEDVPELITIDTLSNLYEATIFTHLLHADMAAMSGGCTTCHHFNPPGKVLACVECHEAGTRSDLSEPSLKGAYHRQCLNCHREWSHTTNCVVCHEKKGSVNVADKTEFLGKSHDPMEIPSKLVYTVDDEDYPLVTFYHNEHNEVFGLSCAQCHQDESCSRCHDTMAQTAVNADEDSHEKCIACHEAAIDDDCEKCHGVVEKAPFDHARTGWALNEYHQPLRCNSCHRDNEFRRLSTGCLSCHRDWKKNRFEHAVTGLQLDENHVENDCTDCHVDYDFNRKPFCNDCHDGYAFPGHKPGKMIRY